MNPTRTIVFLLVLATLLAGCTGGDKAPKTVSEDAPPPPAEEAVATADTGSVRGQLLTVELEPLAKERVTLVGSQANASLRTVVTDGQGRFTFNGLEPGHYRIHVAALCCVEVFQPVVVNVGAVTDMNLLMERIVVYTPFITEDEWTGFLSCSVGVLPCGATDASDDPTHLFELSPGLSSLVVGAAWDPAGGFPGRQLRVVAERQQAPENNFIYLDITGESPLVGVVSDDNVTEEAAHFANITADGLQMRFRVSAVGYDFVYQQRFTVYWQMWHHGKAPLDTNPIPDG